MSRHLQFQRSAAIARAAHRIRSHDDPWRDLLRRRRRARSLAEIGRRRGGDRGHGRRCALAGRAFRSTKNRSQRIALGRRRVVRGGLAGVEEVVVAQACKAALRSETGAAAVDMESHIAAAYAAEAGLPFAALRVISDPASRALPALARARDQAERRYRPAQDPARRRAQSAGRCAPWSRPASISIAR